MNGTEAEARARERVATQVASSGSHVTDRVWCVRRCAIMRSNRSSQQHRSWKITILVCVACGEDVFLVEDSLLITVADVESSSTLMRYATYMSDCRSKIKGKGARCTLPPKTFAVRFFVWEGVSPGSYSFWRWSKFSSSWTVAVFDVGGCFCARGLSCLHFS